MKRKTAKTAIIVLIPIAVAYLCNMMNLLGICGMALGHVLGYARALIYLAIFTFWFIRIKRTVQQQATKRYLLIIGGMMIFWLFIHSIKLEFPLSPIASRACWYLYYLPMIFIPVAALLAAKTIGKVDSDHPSRLAAFLWIVSAALLIMVLTNDFNQLVFVFPEDVPHFMWSDSKYSYGIGYLLVVSWMLICGTSALAVMCVKCMMPHFKGYFLISLVPIGIALIYTIIYCLGVDWLRFWLGDMTVVHCLLFAANIEWCIMCGMIRSNSGYAQLFEVSYDCSAQILDESFRVQYSSRDALPAAGWQIRQALRSPITLHDGKVLHSMQLSGGYAVWTEDIADLLMQEAELRDLREEWQERNELLRLEYTIEEKRRKIEEQNRLYDLIQVVTQKQIDGISNLVQEYQWQEKDSDAARIILSKITVLTTYIKRRRHLELIADRDARVPARELEMAFAESLRALELLGVTSSLFVSVSKTIVGTTATMFYDFFENIVELGMGKLQALHVRVVDREDGIRITITAECSADLSSLSEQYPEVELDNYEGEQTCVLTVKIVGEQATAIANQNAGEQPRLLTLEKEGAGE